jgi:hypothetical protein
MAQSPYKVGDRLQAKDIFADNFVHIYGLYDPAMPEQIRYVGQTRRPSYRLHVHCDGAGRANQWIAELRECGQVPEMVILDIVERVTKNGNNQAEREWIEKLTREGHDLLNNDHKTRRFAREAPTANAA